MRVRIALAVGLAVTAVALGLVLSRPPLTVAGTNEIPANFAVTFINGGQTVCQGGGTVPSGTTAIRVSLSANIGPSVHLDVFSGSRRVSQGDREAGWGVDETVTVGIERVPRTIPNAHVCIVVGKAVEAIQVNGARVRVPHGQAVWLRLEYMRRGPSTWLSLIPAVAKSFGLGHAPSGSWGAYLVVAAMIGLSIFVSRSILRELR